MLRLDKSARVSEPRLCSARRRLNRVWQARAVCPSILVATVTFVMLKGVNMLYVLQLAVAAFRAATRGFLAELHHQNPTRCVHMDGVSALQCLQGLSRRGVSKVAPLRLTSARIFPICSSGGRFQTFLHALRASMQTRLQIFWSVEGLSWLIGCVM